MLRTRKTKEYEEIINKQILLFNKMRSASGFHVIEGITRKNAKRNEQKGVDVNIAVDMLMHTYRKNMDKAYIFTGDSDFIPLVKSLIIEGMYVTLIYDKKSTSNDLLLEVDDKIVFDFDSLSRLINLDNVFRFKYNIAPIRISANEAGLQIDKGLIKGYVYQDPIAPRKSYEGDDAIVNLYKKDDVFCLDIPYSQCFNYVNYFSKDLNLFRFYLDDHGIHIDWEKGIINNKI